MRTQRWIVGLIALFFCLTWVAELRAQELSVDAVEHVGHIERDGAIRWETTVLGDVTFPVEGRQVLFEHPLGREWSLEGDLEAIRDARGRLIGVEEPLAEGDRRFSFTTVYRGSAGALPGVRGTAPERYWLDNGRFEPRESGPLERRIGSLTIGEVEEVYRDRLEEAFGEAPLSARPVVYSHRWPESHSDGEGLVRIESNRSFRERVFWLAGGGFLACVLLVVGAMRWLRRGARAEAADAYLREMEEELETM